MFLTPSNIHKLVQHLTLSSIISRCIFLPSLTNSNLLLRVSQLQKKHSKTQDTKRKRRSSIIKGNKTIFCELILQLGHGTNLFVCRLKKHVFMNRNFLYYKNCVLVKYSFYHQLENKLDCHLHTFGTFVSQAPFPFPCANE